MSHGVSDLLSLIKVSKYSEVLAESKSNTMILSTSILAMCLLITKYHLSTTGSEHAPIAPIAGEIDLNSVHSNVSCMKNGKELKLGNSMMQCRSKSRK